jgi:hypothetical protein
MAPCGRAITKPSTACGLIEVRQRRAPRVRSDDYLVDMQRRPLNSIVVFGAHVAFGGALVAAFFAYVTKKASCEPDCRGGVLTVQLVLAVAGLLPAGSLVYAAVSGRRRLAAIALVTGVLVYGSWALLNNVAVHGSPFGG